MSAPIVKTLLAGVALAVSCLAWAGEKGHIGISISVTGEGFFLNPTLKTVTVAKVYPGSPAASAGMLVGDQILEIEGQAIAGAKANDLRPHLDKDVGQAVRLVIKNGKGEVRQISLVAGAKPD